MARKAEVTQSIRGASSQLQWRHNDRDGVWHPQPFVQAQIK